MEQAIECFLTDLIFNFTNMKKIILIICLSIPLTMFGQSVRPEGTQLITSAGSTTITNGVGVVVINPSLALATLTITLPSIPCDRDVILMQFGGTVTTGTVVTLLSILAGGTPGIIGNPPTAATANNVIAYMYNVTTDKWYRFL